ncbi:MAG: phosphoribosylanthranilate isomerase [Chitinophagaceae bacterium]|nr:phosphoribosylanthranilate isomerase [Chitinophagaceae bacterium]
MNIKVCGITQWNQLLMLDDMEVEFAGFIFYPQSPRYVEGKIDKDDLREAELELKRVGVFVDEDLSAILEKIDEYGLDVVQLHGKESPEYCEALMNEAEIIKAFQIREGDDVDELVTPYDGVCDYYLFDAGGHKTPGGTGRSFNWEILKYARIETPFFLSGGIGPDDVKKIKAFEHPDFFGIDINSLFETAPGYKDMNRISAFLQALR